MAQYTKDFSNLTLGDVSVATLLADGWTNLYNANIAGSDLQAVADATVPGGVSLKLTSNGANEALWVFLTATNETTVDQDILMLTKFSAPTSFDSVGAQAVVRAWNDPDEYGNRFGLGYSGSAYGTQIAYRVNGNETMDTWYTGTIGETITATEWTWVRVQHEDNGDGTWTNRLRAWPYSGSEPATWDFEATGSLTEDEWNYTAYPTLQNAGMGFCLNGTNAPAGATNEIGFFGASDDLLDPVTVLDATGIPENYIDDVSIVDGVVSLITRPYNGNALLATMNFPVLADSSELHLDLRWTESAATNPITPPYTGLIDWLVAYDGTTKITVTDNGDGTVNIPAGSEGNDIVFGIPYTFSITPTRVFMRDRDGQITDLDRLSLNYFEVWANGTSLTTSVAPGKGRGPYAGTWDLTDEKYDERVKVPVMADAEDAVITITDATPWALTISRMGWEGRYFPRTRRAR